MKPKLGVCILLTILLVPVAGILLFAALFSFLAGTADLMLLALGLAVVAIAFLALVVFLWVKRAKAVREESKHIY